MTNQENIPSRKDPRFSQEPSARKFSETEKEFLSNIDVSRDNDEELVLYFNTNNLSETDKELVELAYDAYYRGFLRDNDNNWFANATPGKGV
mgnify:FL=1